MGGDFSAFFDGPIYDAPWDIVSALHAGLSVLSWFENLPKEEQPPRSIWWSEELVEDWFEKVRDKRKNPRKRSPYEEADDVPMSRNELVDKAKLIHG